MARVLGIQCTYSSSLTRFRFGAFIPKYLNSFTFRVSQYFGVRNPMLGMNGGKALRVHLKSSRQNLEYCRTSIAVKTSLAVFNKTK